jgi:hypothetical protein
LLLARQRETTLYVSGTVSNQGRFYADFDDVVLLSAPADVLLARIAHRTTNDYGKSPRERELIRQHIAEVEPLLRATCTHEIDAAQPLDAVVAALVAIGEDRRVPFRKKPKERVEPLNEAELAWVAESVATARAAIESRGLGRTDPPTAESLDKLWRTIRDEPADPNEAINCVGLAFGQLLVDRFGLAWVALTDEYGTEIAVRGPSDFTVFPTNFVAKRYESGESDFLAPFVDEVGRTLRTLS